ncbi:MAG: 2-dehydropantoate 2-reductase N-terminal domain-containing protein [Tepidiformaceae bacterium]
MRIVVVGAGVIGSVYGAQLAHAGHDVTLLARGKRFADLHLHGLVIEDADSGQRTELTLPVLNELAAGDRYDLALVPVRAEQLASTLPILVDMSCRADVLSFGNTLGHQQDLVAALGERALFGFPGASGVRDGHIIKYVLIRQQKTMLGEADGTTTTRVRELQTMFGDAGLPTSVSANIGGWMLGHTAFIVPIGFALYRFGTSSTALAADASTVRLMVRATREAFEALDNVEIPSNLRWLYLRMPTAFAVRYWCRVLASPRGELWFAAHSRAAPDEMRALAQELRGAVQRTGRPTPNFDALLGTS